MAAAMTGAIAPGKANIEVTTLQNLRNSRRLTPRC